MAGALRASWALPPGPAPNVVELLESHAFAAAFLMPKQDIHDELPATPDWSTLFDLKRRWQVSLAALLIRAKTLGRMNDATYLAAVKAASVRGWRRSNQSPSANPNNLAIY